MSSPSAGTDARDDRWPRRLAEHVGEALRLLLRPARLPTVHVTAFDPRRCAVIAAVTFVVLVVMALLFDAALARGARGLPRWIVDMFDDITGFGKSGWFLWPLGVGLLVMAALPERMPERTRLVMIAILVRFQFLFAAIAVPSLFVTIVKRVIGRGRPFVGGSLDPWHVKPFNWTAAYASFPSGHATTAAAVAVAIATLWPRTRTVMLIYAVLILTSRVVLTAHYLTDVLAGALVGAGGAMLVRRYFAARRLGFSIRPDGGIVQYPMPPVRRVKAVARAFLAE